MKTIDKRAFLTNFELACEAGIVALAADLLWVVHDAIQNGFSIWYFLIGGGISIGIALTAFALVRHHKHYTHRLMRKLAGVGHDND